MKQAKGKHCVRCGFLSRNLRQDNGEEWKQSLDSEERENIRGQKLIRKIEGDWYLSCNAGIWCSMSPSGEKVVARLDSFCCPRYVDYFEGVNFEYYRVVAEDRVQKKHATFSVAMIIVSLIAAIAAWGSAVAAYLSVWN